MEILKDISAIIGLITALIGLIGLLSKGFRNIVKSFILRNTQDIIALNEQQSKDIGEINTAMEQIKNELHPIRAEAIQSCKNVIKDIYYEYRDAQRLPLYERNILDQTFKIYNDYFKENGEIKLMYKEVCKWAIDSNPFKDTE